MPMVHASQDAYLYLLLLGPCTLALSPTRHAFAMAPLGASRPGKTSILHAHVCAKRPSISSTSLLLPVTTRRTPSSTNISHMFQVGSGAAFSAASRRLRREVPAPERANMPLRLEASKPPDVVPAPDGADNFDVSHDEIKISFDGNNSVHFVEFIKDIIVKFVTVYSEVFTAEMLTSGVKPRSSLASLAVNTTGTMFLEKTGNSTLFSIVNSQPEPSSKNNGLALMLTLMLFPLLGILLITTCGIHRHHGRHRAHRGAEEDDRGHDRVPPAWGPESWRTTTFRAWTTDILLWQRTCPYLSLIHISEPTRPY